MRMKVSPIVDETAPGFPYLKRVKHKAVTNSGNFGVILPEYSIILSYHMSIVVLGSIVEQ